MKKLLIAGLMALTAGSASAGTLIIQHNGVFDLYFNVVDEEGRSQEHFTLSFLHKGWTDGHGRRTFHSQNGTSHVDLIPLCANQEIITYEVPKRGKQEITIGGACHSVTKTGK